MTPAPSGCPCCSATVRWAPRLDRSVVPERTSNEVTDFDGLSPMVRELLPVLLALLDEVNTRSAKCPCGCPEKAETIGWI